MTKSEAVIRAGELRDNGIVIRVHLVPAQSPWRIHGTHYGYAEQHGRQVTQTAIGGSWLEAACDAIEMAERFLRDSAELSA